MKVRELEGVLDPIAPLRFAESWDNVGLLAGDRDAEVSRVLVTIDLTLGVLEEARRERASMVVAYHPVILKPVNRLASGHVLFEAIRDGIHVYCPHTALDAAEGGTNDVLGDVLGMTTRAPLRPVSAAGSGELKLVTFVPTTDADRVSDAMFRAGAGVIGAYESCSFRSQGQGTFFGGPEANPRVGEKGRLERVAETRVEMRVRKGVLAAVLEALRSTHPYEEPAFDLLTLEGAGRQEASKVGMGRIGTVTSIERSALIETIRGALGVSNLLVAGKTTGSVTKVATCAGAGGELLGEAIAKGAELYLTGELRHHYALMAVARGVTVVAALHSNSERITLTSYASKLRERAKGVEVLVSKVDRDPFSIV